MNYLIASNRCIKKEIPFSNNASIGVLTSFIPIHFAIGIRSTYRFQFTSFLESEFHEKFQAAKLVKENGSLDGRILDVGCWR